jgi:hypothetical protein
LNVNYRQFARQLPSIIIIINGKNNDDNLISNYKKN